MVQGEDFFKKSLDNDVVLHAFLKEKIIHWAILWVLVSFVIRNTLTGLEKSYRKRSFIKL